MKQWNWSAFGVGLAAASFVWAIFWAIYTRRTEARQAVRTTREIERTKREIDGIRALHSAAANVVQMADNLLETHQGHPDQVSQGLIAVKMSGRIKGLREEWLKYERDIRVNRLRRSYKALQMSETLAWFEGGSSDGGTTKATVAEAMRRVDETRVLADAVRASAEDASA
jgi:hypothetical protein